MGALIEIITEARQCLKDIFVVQEKLGLVRRGKAEDVLEKRPEQELPFESRKKVLKIVDVLRARITPQVPSQVDILGAIDSELQSNCQEEDQIIAINGHEEHQD